MIYSNQEKSSTLTWSVRRSLTNVARAEWLHLVQALVAVRVDAGLSQSELARRLGRRQSYVWKVENSQQRIDVVELIEICRACGASPEAVFSKFIRSLAPGETRSY